jgi:hypothetical protein
MKKYVAVVLTLTLFAPSLVLANSDENVTKRRPDRPANIEIQEIRGERQDKREEGRAKMQDFRSHVAENHANRLSRRFAFYYNRLNDIITRFQSRLDSLKTAGKDTSAAQTALDKAKTSLASAKSKGDAAVAAFKAIDPAKFTEQKAEALAARDLANEARKLFLDTHTLLKDAFKALKVISKPALPAASAAVENAQ